MSAFETQTKAFSPAYGLLKTLSVTTSNQLAAAQLLDAVAANRCDEAMVYNSGATLCFVRFGKGTQVGEVLDMPVPPGAYFVLGIGDATHVDAVTASGTTTLLIMLGQGQ